MTQTKRLTALRLAAVGLTLAMGGGVYAQSHTGQQKSPIKLGTSGGSVKNLTTSYCCSGTLGAQVKDAAGKTYILSNNHVLALDNAGKVGDRVMHRGYVDSSCSTKGTIIVGTLTKFAPITFTSSAKNTVDAAIAATVTGKVNTTGFILGIGPVSKAPAKAAVNMIVEKSGRSGMSSGTISAVNVSVLVGGYGVCGCGQTGQPACQPNAKFVGQFTITPGSFIQPGDSGSLVVKPGATGKRANPVGLIFAGSSSSAVANPIGAVMKAFTVTFGAAEPTAEELADAADVPDVEVEAASAIKDRYDDHLFTLPEVVGHGVSKDASGHPVIQLFVKHDTETVRQAAPLTLEGIPVQVVETGEFRVNPVCESCASCKH